jgi:hypothetical protein
MSALDNRRAAAHGQLARQKAESGSATLQAGVSVLGGILGAVFGRKSGLGSLSRGAASLGPASGAYKQHQDVAIADAKVAAVLAEIETAKAGLEAAVQQLTDSYDPASLKLEAETLKPTRTNIEVRKVALLWIPEE